MTREYDAHDDVAKDTTHNMVDCPLVIFFCFEVRHIGQLPEYLQGIP